MNDPEPQRWFAYLRVEVDVTPRWFNAGANFHDDLLAILTTWRDVAGDLLRMTVDIQAGTAGIRVVLAVPVGVTFEQVEAARGTLKTALDALDLSSPRRRAVTEARVEAVKRRQGSPAAFAGEGGPPEPLLALDSVATPPDGRGGRRRK